jgi:Na+-transporting methylmalonyl-CoA/oxaloacetate decarboxylase gamma subunit
MFSTWIGMVLLFAFFGLLVLVVIGASPRGDRFEEKRAKDRVEKLQKAREQTAQALTTYAWVDKNKGVVRIPINDAMKLTVAELAQRSPAPANPIVAEVSPAPQSAVPTNASPTPSATVGPSETPKPAAVTGPDSTNRNQPAATNNPPPAPPGSQPGASATPAAAPPSAAVKAPASPSATPAPSAPGTPLPVRGKTP